MRDILQKHFDSIAPISSATGSHGQAFLKDYAAKTDSNVTHILLMASILNSFQNSWKIRKYTNIVIYSNFARAMRFHMY